MDEHKKIYSYYDLTIATMQMVDVANELAMKAIEAKDIEKSATFIKLIQGYVALWQSFFMEMDYELFEKDSEFLNERIKNLMESYHSKFKKK